MTTKCILARVDGTEDDRAVLDAALQVARRFQGHIEVLHVRFDARDLPLVTGYGAVPDLVALTGTFERTAELTAKQARQNFDSWRAANDIPFAETCAGAPDVSVRWQEVSGAEMEIMTRHGRLSDLIVISRPTVESGCSSQVALETALFDTRRPVLMVPRTFRGDLFGKAAIIAWNGSAEASSAVALAMPFLTIVEKVGVFTAIESKHKGKADAFIAYLGWHGITADRVGADPAGGSVGAGLLEAAEDMGAGLVVMGAYTHGRMRQIVFGGVTSHIVRNATLPVLMAH